MRGVLCALELRRMLLGRQQGAACLERMSLQGMLVYQRKQMVRHLSWHMCCAFSFVMWDCGGVVKVCIALHMWCAEHCICCALHVAHVHINDLCVFARGSAARGVGVRGVLGPDGGGAGMATSSGGAGRPPASSAASSSAGPPWVQEVKKRMPRHQDEEDAEEWFLPKTIPSAERWYHAEQFMLKQRNEGGMMKMDEAFDMVRRDLATTRAAWYPQKWTTMVEGRPVQV